MRSAVLIFSAYPDFAKLSDAYRNIGSVSLPSSDCIVVESNWGWFVIGVEAELEDEFSELERSRVRLSISKPIFAQLQYSLSEAANLAINSLPVVDTVLIDNDHGSLRTIDEVRDLIAKNFKWQTDDGTHRSDS